MVRELITSDEEKEYAQKAKVFNTPERMKALVSPIAWKILELTSKEPMYPLQIAKKLNIHEQKIYYHINKLVKAELVKVVMEKEIKGANAKYYSPVSPVFAVALDYGKTILKNNKLMNSKIFDFFREFNNDSFNGLIVVGSPEAHGPLQSWAKDGHYANIVSFFLGNFINFSNEHFIDLDVNVKAREKYNENFILIGGPGVNVVTYEFNNYLPVKFLADFAGEAPSATFGTGFKSSKTKKLYTNPNIGVIQKIENPHDKNKRVIVLAGITKKGTLTAIKALTSNNKDVLKDYKHGKNFSRVVEGQDLSGDGRIDSFEVLE
ncbi:hypothetical protein COS83_00585 [archaeon CG07_land_8_20_14_0_80_38_8]|nr:MAG: hypothetical protein COS83_00585 [archaeon CG07_land_8_20_14_0_80_38_8]